MYVEVENKKRWTVNYMVDGLPWTPFGHAGSPEQRHVLRSSLTRICTATEYLKALTRFTSRILSNNHLLSSVLSGPPPLILFSTTSTDTLDINYNYQLLLY